MRERLSTERWRVVIPYLDRALDLGEGERAPWLSAIRVQDPALADDLEVLLEKHDALGGFLDEGPDLSPEETSLAGQAIGACTLRSPIGQGGMGSVWLAERSDGRYQGLAAVKLLNASLVGRDGEARFRREGSVLARLRHPHIAHLIDAGVSPLGQPYLVLERVDGERIDRYCDARNMGVEPRIRLFLDVLAAVAHAHANLVVHRDIKPSNVLVDTDGRVKLLDFGVAKLLESEGGGEVTTLTREGESAMTPEYAAPEQLTGGNVTTATDVYALGALLYVLLAGQHPAGARASSPAELIRAIVDTEAPRLSDAAMGVAADTRTDTAAQRATTPKKLRSLLRGDLDNIVAKALKKDASQRYASVEALADDLRRYLGHQPVSARADSLVYRAAKFVRRNRWSVAAAALTVAGLSAGLFVANRERAIAQRRFVQVRQLANKLFDIDVQVRQLAGSTKARQVIVDTALEYLQRQAAEVRGDPELALEVGTAYMRVARVQGVPISVNLGQMDKAEQNLRVAEGLVQSVLAAQPGNRTAFLRMAQVSHDRMILAGLRRPDDEALPLARKSATWLDSYLDSGKVEPAETEQVAIVLINVGNRYRLEGQFDEALRLTARSLDIVRSFTQRNVQLQLGGALVSIARIHRDRGALDEALQSIREAASTLEPPPGAIDQQGRTINFASALAVEGAILGEAHGVSLGRPDEAVIPLRRSLRIVDEIAHQDPTDAESRSRVSINGRWLAALLFHSDPGEALAVYDHVLRHLAEIKDNSRFRRDEVRALAGSTYPLRRLGRAAEARRRLDDAFARLSALKLYPAPQVELGSEADDALRALGDHEAATGDVPRAIETYRLLLDRVTAAGTKPENNLAQAAGLSRLQASLADLHRRSGQADLASGLDASRRQLWQRWDGKLPNNAFVRRQLAAAR